MSRSDVVERLREHAPVVLPSMLLCDFGDLRTEISRVEAAGVHALHLDVMDGVFVPNFSYGMTIVDAVNRITDLPLDVHLMMVNPQNYLTQFVDAGADIITVHAEAVDDAAAVLKSIRKLGVAAGIAINPKTPSSAVEGLLEHADMVLAMSVQPGFGGQSFNAVALTKLEEIRQMPGGESVLLEIDGGINKSTINTATRSGAEMLVAGSAIFRQDNYLVAHEELLAEAAGVSTRGK